VSFRHQSNRSGALFVLTLLAPLSGIGAGFIGAAFRFTLAEADFLRGTVIAWAYGSSIAGFVLVVALVAASAATAAWMVRRFAPSAPGSGIPQVEAELNEELAPASPRLIVVKFLGGVLAIGSGLALGREGPSIQMGASIAYHTGRLFRRSWADCKILLAAGAGAGLATAFNAPLSGAVFVIEELLKRFDARSGIAALAASATAIWVERWMLGNAPDFQVGHLLHPDFAQETLFVLFGLATGLAGILYNKILIGGLQTAGLRMTSPGPPFFILAAKPAS
jgi:chloride channel protein, CIC family